MEGPTFEEIFEGKQDKFERKIDITQKLLSKLQAYKLITNDHRNDIEVSYAAVAEICCHRIRLTTGTVLLFIFW